MYGNQKFKDQNRFDGKLSESLSSSTICHAWRMKKAHHTYLMGKKLIDSRRTQEKCEQKKGAFEQRSKKKISTQKK